MGDHVKKPYDKPVGRPLGGSGIQIKLIQTATKPSPKIKSTTPFKPSKPVQVASVFNVDSDEDEEEMPPEAKMRMKNIGRDTPTSAGPNSFGKTKIGFCNVNEIKERQLQDEIAKRKKN